VKKDNLEINMRLIYWTENGGREVEEGNLTLAIEFANRQSNSEHVALLLAEFFEEADKRVKQILSEIRAEGNDGEA
jgi:hypothetical protein